MADWAPCEGEPVEALLCPEEGEEPRWLRGVMRSVPAPGLYCVRVRTTGRWAGAVVVLPLDELRPVPAVDRLAELLAP